MSSAALVDDSIASSAPPPARSTFAISARLLLVVACVLVGIRAIALLSAVPTAHSERVSAYFADGERYHHIAAHPGTPYADFEVEYPPVTLAFIEVVAQGDVRDTLRNVGIASFAFDLLTLGALAYGFSRRAALAYLVLSTPLFLLPFVYFRVDFLVVALTMWGLALVKRGHDASGGTLLALAVFAKLWPLTVVPLVFVQRKPRAIVSVIACGAVGALGWLVVGGTAGFQQVLTFRGARGFQIESVIGGVTRMFSGETPRSESGALRVGDAPFAVNLVLGALLLAGVGWVWWQVYRSGTTKTCVLYAIAPLTAVAMFMVCAPLLSPQFILWLVPFGAIAWANDERALAALVGLGVVTTMLLTQVYAQLNDDLAIGHAVLAVRNGLLLALVVVGLVRLRAVTRTAMPEPVVA